MVDAPNRSAVRHGIVVLLIAFAVFLVLLYVGAFDIVQSPSRVAQYCEDECLRLFPGASWVVELEECINTCTVVGEASVRSRVNVVAFILALLALALWFVGAAQKHHVYSAYGVGLLFVGVGIWLWFAWT